MMKEEHLKQNFIGGLRDELKALVCSSCPRTLKDAYTAATHKELVL